ncbi:MAG: hypothetical protein LBB53_01285 [Prevotellaceae bacterium]|jgi:hypothetical protein|nr:hypothetical protein [Prevotellaceae bacterium]
MISEKNASCITVNNIDIKKDDIEHLSALRYSIRDMALFFELPEEVLEKELSDSNSLFSYYFKRGRLIYEIKEQVALLDSAQGGNVTAGERLEKIRRDRSFTVSKEDIFGSFNSEVEFSKLEEYILSGSSTELDNDEQIYIDVLRIIDGMERHYGRRNTLKVLQKTFNLTFERSRIMLDEATNLFYTDRNQDRKALRNKRAEMLMDMAVLARERSHTSRDLEVAGGLVVQASKLQELDKQEPPVLSQEQYRKPVMIFSLRPEDVGIFGIDRREVLNQIEKNLTVPESVKIRLKHDAHIEDVIPVENLLEEAKQNCSD